MKKNISINISGIIFHIEEDGYDRLKNYLESINKYFATYEDSKEIIEDIENRIAEIFLTKLSDGKQVVSSEDVDSLITTMGSIADFEAAEEQEDISQRTTDREEKQKTTEGDAKAEQAQAPKKLYRDNKRKLLGGVAAGIANYFGLDPLWIRLILIILFFNLIIGVVSGLVLIGYIICWIIIPGSDELEEDKKMKKLYRNSEDRVIGGVSGGLAAYFGADTNLIRLLFVLTAIIGGTGLILYLILWIITPLATSITDKIQMKGEPVTLSTIESNVKKGLNVEPEEEENIFVRILLFPFRLLSTVFSGLGRVLGPFLLFIVEAIRIFAGAVIFITGVSMILAFTISIGVILGLMAGGDIFYMSNEIPIDIIKASFPPYTSVAAYLSVLVPSLLLTLVGISIILKRSVISTTLGWSMFGVWIISILALSVTVPAIVNEFKREGEYRVTETYDLGDKMAVLTLREVGMENYRVAKLKLRGHSDDSYRLVKNFESRGRTRQRAIENAKMVDYTVALEDSVFIFDSNIEFKRNADFRAQELDMTLYIPYNKPFKMDYDMSYIIRNTLWRNGYRSYQLEDNTWMFTEDGLQCITCEDAAENEKGPKIIRTPGSTEILKELDISGFNEIEAGHTFDIEIAYGENYEISINGKEDDLDHVIFDLNGDHLKIGMDYTLQQWNEKKHDIEVSIVTPALESIDFGGASKASIRGFVVNDFDVKLSGSADVEMEIEAEDINIVMSGSSNLQLNGRGQEMKAELSGTSDLEAIDFTVEHAEVEARGASNAEINARENIDIKEYGSSQINYIGNPKVNKIRSTDSED
ncbi:PspC domain-containing protein [Fulvivirgaceae bacterium BMA10]|uniref:PspC domain-containing protein n=1 Tax=Splendidivirga corallicola TaxID=3051826 RepID=A0ABT8KKZ2_9BACT|nr:PspC domain-containing protein [Fulvivirgaceae bacterium BMA10]